MKNSIYLLACLVLLMPSCRAKKGVSSHATGMDSPQLRFETCIKNEAFKESLQSKISLELSLPDKILSSRATLKIVKNRFIQLSIHPIMGIEMFRLVLSPDNILLIDRMNKRYVNEPIEALESLLKMDLDFNMLQALFSNQLFYPHQTVPVDFKLFDSMVSVDSIVYSAKTKTGYDCTFILDATARLIRTTVESPAQQAALQWDYSEFVPVAKIPFPSQINISIPSSKGVGLKIKGSDFQPDTSIDIDTSVSSRYEKISLSQLYNMLQKL